MEVQSPFFLKSQIPPMIKMKLVGKKKKKIKEFKAYVAKEYLAHKINMEACKKDTL
jgi:hypothetical protein